MSKTLHICNLQLVTLLTTTHALIGRDVIVEQLDRRMIFLLFLEELHRGYARSSHIGGFMSSSKLKKYRSQEAWDRATF